MSDKSQKSKKSTTSKSKTRSTSSSSSPKSLSDVMKIIEDRAATNQGSALEALKALSQGSSNIRHNIYYPVLREHWRSLPVQTKAIKYVLEMANIAKIPENLAKLLKKAGKLPVAETIEDGWDGPVNIHEMQNYQGWPRVTFKVVADEYDDDISEVEIVFCSEHVECELLLWCQTRTVEKSKSKEETFLKCLSDVTLKFAPYDNLLKRETAFKDIFHSTLDVACELNQKKESTEINFTSIKVRTKVPDSYKKAVNENNELLFDSWIPLVRTFKMMKKQWGSYSNKNARYHVQLNRVMQEISGAIDAPLLYNPPLDPELTRQEEAADQAAGEKQYRNLRKTYPQKFADLYEELKLD